MAIDFATILPTESLEEYKKLDEYINKLLAKIRLNFHGNHEDYLFFLGYLVETVAYSHSIENIDSTLILLLHNIDKYWLTENGFNKDIKQNIIKWIILQHMTSVVNGTAAKNKKTVKKFLEGQTTNLENILTKQQTEIAAIFSHEINFLNRNAPQLTFYRNNTQLMLWGCLLIAAITSPSTVRLFLYFNATDLNVRDNFSDRRELIKLQDAVDTAFFSLPALFLAGVIKSFNWYIKSPRNHFLQKLNIDKFVFYNREHLQLLVPTIREIDQTWFEYSVLSRWATKEPLMFRIYVHQQLNSLKTEETMTSSMLVSLLHALVITEKTPQLSDIPYSIPVDLLAKPESHWLQYSVLKPIKYRSLLQQYTKLAMIEFLNGELKSITNITEFDKKALVKKLQLQHDEIVQHIRELNSIQANHDPHDDFFKLIAIGAGIFCFSLISIVFVAHYVGQRVNCVNSEPNNSFSSTIAIGTSIAAAITTCFLFRAQKVKPEREITMQAFISQANTNLNLLPEPVSQMENII